MGRQSYLRHPFVDWKRKRKERINQPPSKLNVDVHGILFAIVAVVFVIYPLAQYFLGL